MDERGSTHDILASVFAEPTANTITFQAEPVSQMWYDAIPLMVANHRETGGLPAEYFSPSLSMFQRIEVAGCLRVFTARLDGALIGYGVFALSPHPTYPELTFATAHVVYVDPAHRGRRSIRFLLWMRAELKAEGADYWGLQNSTKHDWSGTLRMLGLEPMETFYVGKL